MRIFTEIFNEYEVFKDAASVDALYFHLFIGRESRRQFVGGHILAMCTKPLIVPSLALFCWLLLKENDVRGRKVATLMLAMAFGALGDVLLMFSDQGFFLAGLFAFLIGHLFYLCTIPYPDKNGHKRIFSFVILALLITIMSIASQLFAVKGFMGMCVTAYACVFAFVIHAGIMAAIETKSRLYVVTVIGYVLLSYLTRFWRQVSLLI